MKERFAYLRLFNTYSYAVQYRTVVVHEEAGSSNRLVSQVSV